MSTYTSKHREYYLRNRERILSLRKEREQRWLQTPQGKYSVQKRKAKQRGIIWEFTFDTWWEWWQQSGQWENRGDETGKYCMSRFNDTGPYHPNNCYCNLFEENTREVYFRRGINEKGQLK